VRSELALRLDPGKRVLVHPQLLDDGGHGHRGTSQRHLGDRLQWRLTALPRLARAQLAELLLAVSLLAVRLLALLVSPRLLAELLLERLLAVPLLTERLLAELRLERLLTVPLLTERLLAVRLLTELLLAVSLLSDRLLTELLRVDGHEPSPRGCGLLLVVSGEPAQRSKPRPSNNRISDLLLTGEEVKWC
jgi:hypothetical protein